MLPNVDCFDSVHNGRIIVNHPDTPRCWVYLARAIREYIAGQIGKTIRGVSNSTAQRGTNKKLFVDDRGIWVGKNGRGFVYAYFDPNAPGLDIVFSLARDVRVLETMLSSA